MNMNTQTTMNIEEFINGDLLSFVVDTQPDLEMCYDFCESQGVEITKEVEDTIESYLFCFVGN